MGRAEVLVDRWMAWLLVIGCACGARPIEDELDALGGSGSDTGEIDETDPPIVVLGFDGAVLELGELDDATRGITSDPGLVGTYAPAGAEVDRLQVLGELRDALASLDVVVVPAIPHPARYSLVVVTPTQAPGYPAAPWVAPLDRDGDALDWVDADVGVVIAHDTDAAVAGALAVIDRALGLAAEK